MDSNAGENLIAIADVLIVEIGERLRVGGIVLLALGNGEDLFRMADGERAKEEGADQAEDDGIGADAEGERKNGNDRENGILTELPKAITSIREYGMERAAETLFADLFFYLLEAAEFDASGALRFVGGHAVAEIFVSEEGEVGLDFVVEVGVDATEGEKVAEERTKFREEGHA
jgi:hypothetical protein